MDSSVRSSEGVRIRPLSRDLVDDYFVFFDHEAFTDNPRWASCYCYFHHSPHDREPWGDRTADQNRAAVMDLIERGGLRGYLAYLDGKPVGWCNANLHSRYTTLDDQPNRDRTGAIVCFIVAKPYRRIGVARHLLLAACRGFQDQGLEAIEALARTDTTDEAANHHGPLSMYQAAGFEAVGATGSIVVVRKSLGS